MIDPGRKRPASRVKDPERMGPHQSKTQPRDSGTALQGKTVPKARPLLEHTLWPVGLNQAGPYLEAGSAQGPPSFATLRSWNPGIGLGHYTQDGGKRHDSRSTHRPTLRAQPFRRITE